MKYQLKTKRYFYDTRPIWVFVTDDNGHPLIYDDRSEAEYKLKKHDEGMYELAHGEYSRPDYKIFNKKD